MNAYEDAHPLREGTRPIQRELYTPAPLGHPVTTQGDAPTTAVDADAFRSADGDVTGRSMTTGPAFISLRGYCPAFQEQLHPFGMLDHSVSSLGYLTVANALDQTLPAGRRRESGRW